jgi:hypothetical protein
MAIIINEEQQVAKKQTTANQQPKYGALADTRRYSDGVRVHEHLGYILMNGGNDLRDRYPDSRVSRAEFSRAAIPVLARLGFITLIDPEKPLPDWLQDRDRKLARRGGMQPIWMPTPNLPDDVWRRVVSGFRNGEITWATPESSHGRSVRKVLH